MQFLFSCSCPLANAAATGSALPTRVAIKKNSRRDAKQKEVIPLALSDLFATAAVAAVERRRRCKEVLVEAGKCIFE